MLGVSFTELGLIFVVALVVLGPARLPGLVRKVGRWIGKARSMARDFQQQLESEINLEELNRITEVETKKSRTQTGSSSPETAEEPASAQPATESGASAESGPDQLSGGHYPYGTQEQTEAAQTDDTYSHAHAAGEAPMADDPAQPADENEKKDSGTGTA